MRRSWVLFGLLLLVSSAWAVEQIELTTPDQATAGTPSYYISRYDMDSDAARVTIYLNSASGLRKTLVITGTDATTYIRAAKKRDFTSTSLDKWTFNQLKLRGYLDGTVTGTPD